MSDFSSKIENPNLVGCRVDGLVLSSPSETVVWNRKTSISRKKQGKVWIWTNTSEIASTHESAKQRRSSFKSGQGACIWTVSLKIVDFSRVCRFTIFFLEKLSSVSCSDWSTTSAFHSLRWCSRGFFFFLLHLSFFANYLSWNEHLISVSFFQCIQYLFYFSFKKNSVEKIQIQSPLLTLRTRSWW